MRSMESLTQESATSRSPAAPDTGRHNGLAWLRPWMRVKVYVGGFIVMILVVVGIVGPFIAPHNPNAQQLRLTLQAPQWFGSSHFLGTDNLGRDVLSRIIYGARGPALDSVLPRGARSGAIAENARLRDRYAGTGGQRQRYHLAPYFTQPDANFHGHRHLRYGLGYYLRGEPEFSGARRPA